MIHISDLIAKLKEIEEYYPNVDIDITKIILHVSIYEDVPYITFGKDKKEPSILQGR